MQSGTPFRVEFPQLLLFPLWLQSRYRLCEQVFAGAASTQSSTTEACFIAQTPPESKAEQQTMGIPRQTGCSASSVFLQPDNCNRRNQSTFNRKRCLPISRQFHPITKPYKPPTYGSYYVLGIKHRCTLENPGQSDLFRQRISMFLQFCSAMPYWYYRLDFYRSILLISIGNNSSVIPQVNNPFSPCLTSLSSEAFS